MDTLNIKKISIKITDICNVGYESDPEYYLSLNIGGKCLFRIQSQKPWLLDNDIVYLHHILNLEDPRKITIIDKYDDEANCTQDPRILRITKALNGREFKD